MAVDVFWNCNPSSLFAAIVQNLKKGLYAQQFVGFSLLYQWIYQELLHLEKPDDKVKLLCYKSHEFHPVSQYINWKSFSAINGNFELEANPM